MISKHLPWHGLTAQLFLKFLLITQHEVPFINTSEATKRSSNRTENGKCTDHKPSKSCRLVNPNLHKHRYNYKTPDLFSLSRIFTDLIMHNYRSNQSALMTRCGTDLRHQYGIFGGKSQTSVSRNATRPGAKKGGCFRRLAKIPFEVLKLQWHLF